MSTLVQKTEQQTPFQLIDLDSIKRKKVNLAVFGHGNVGSRLIDQILKSQKELKKRRRIDLSIFVVANSKTALFQKNGISTSWQTTKREEGKPYSVNEIIQFAKEHNLENCIAIDNTADAAFVQTYPHLVKAGFSLVSSNKIGNTIDLNFYKNLRQTLDEQNQSYLYETNVGAGLPLIDTIKLLHLSGENITRIKGVFSGSLSYLFNTFSEREQSFSETLQQAIQQGYTEPDPREDLCGNDVGRKLLILARELDLHTEMEDVSIQNLIPKHLRTISKENFLNQLHELDVPFHIKRKNLKKDHVLRYIGDLHGDLSKEDGAQLHVSLTAVPKNSVLGQLKGSDSIFEIYTESYGTNPIVIQGAGAGAAVTARGVFGDVLRLSDRLN